MYMGLVCRQSTVCSVQPLDFPYLHVSTLSRFYDYLPMAQFYWPAGVGYISQCEGSLCMNNA